MDLNQLVIFVEVVRAGSFTAAGRALEMPKSTVSRKVAELEARLGVQLLRRTTRQLHLTDIGSAYFERVQRVVEDARGAEELVAELLDEPCGVLRVTAPMSFAFLGAVVSDYLRTNPAVRVDLECTDRKVDLLGEGFDVAIRAGRMTDSKLIARRLGTVPRYLVAAPSYFESRSSPRKPQDLSAHDAVLFSGGDEGRAWTLRSGRKRVEVKVEPRLVVNDYEVLLEAVYAGAGIALLPSFQCQEELGQRLERVLPAWQAPDVPVHAVYYGGHASKKVVAFLDTLQERFPQGA
tara:strand:- start:1108 stop:1983 length:876 start_codon:yes stop_codon:yes gene_type:complete